MASILGPAFAGFTINWIGINWSLAVVFILVVISFLLALLITKKPVLNPKIGEPVLKSLNEGLKFVFNNKAFLALLV